MSNKVGEIAITQRKIDLLQMMNESCYRKGNFKLSSGKESEHYINCKNLTLSSTGLRMISQLMYEMVEENSSAVAGLTLGADPLVAGVSLTSYGKLDAFIVVASNVVISLFKGHGTQAWIEGPPQVEGARVTILEDVITTGGSAIKAADIMRRAGYQVERVVSIVDRQEGGEHAIMNAGLELKSIFTIEDFK